MLGTTEEEGVVVVELGFGKVMDERVVELGLGASVAEEMETVVGFWVVWVTCVTFVGEAAAAPSSSGEVGATELDAFAVLVLVEL